MSACKHPYFEAKFTILMYFFGGASEATLSSCQSRFAIYVGIVRACNQLPGAGTGSTVRVVTFHAKGPGFDPR